MGLINWKNLRSTSISIKILAGIIMILLWVVCFVIFVFNLIKEFNIILLISVGIVFVFFFPFLVFGGYNEISEALDDMKKKKSKE